MTLPILSMAIGYEKDTVAVRRRSRELARLLGFDGQDQTRLATAVSEIARNAFRYAGGARVDFVIEGATAPQLLIITITDKGPGIEDLARILEGRYTSTTGMGMGIIGARRLVDQFEITSDPGKGTRVVLKKVFPRRAPLITASSLNKVLDEISAQRPPDSFGEIEQQNQELLRTLEELRRRQEDLLRLNHELEDTNRGVLALYAELDEKADHLRRADALKTKFLSNMSHEFRSPLNSILALSGLLLNHTDGPLTAEQTQQVTFIKKAADDLYELVNDLLDLAKVEAGKVDVKPVEFDIANLFGALRGMLRPLFINQSVALVFEPCEGFPLLYSDEAKISQVLRNFISNALKFTEQGEVRTGVQLNGDRVQFWVADSGIGIAKQDQERIFEDFTQIENPLQRRSKGTGLGLPLCRQLAKLLQGSVWVRSEVGRGSTFFLEVPLRYHTAELSAPAPEVQPAAAGLPVLVVEDRFDGVLTYSRWLNGSGFRVVHAASTREAAERIAAEHPAAIVLDIILQGEDSWGLLASLKSDEATCNIPVAVVSTIDDPGKAYHLGADAYLVKPVSHKQFLELLHRLTDVRPIPSVLIIDDDEKDRYILRHRLRATGVRIDEAANGPDGIAHAIEKCPDIIFLDLAMSKMNGFEVLEKLKADPRTSSIDVVVHTSLHPEQSVLDRLAGKTVAVISKHQLNESADMDAIVARLRESAPAAAAHFAPQRP